MKKRNVALAIIFSFITFGIYGLYWFVKINHDMQELANADKRTSGLAAFIFTIITFGIYGLYWMYKMGKLEGEAQAQRGKAGGNNGVLYLILGIFGLGIVSYAIMQSNINSMLD